MQNKKLILTLAVFAVFMGIWYVAKIYLFPAPPKPDQTPPGPTTTFTFADGTQTALRQGVQGGAKQQKQAQAEVERSVLALAAGPFIRLAQPSDFHKPKFVAEAGTPKKDSRRITLGSKDPNSKYHLQVEFDSRGGGVRQVVLNKFQAVDGTGQPMWEDADKKVRKLEVLVPEDPNDALSDLIYHFNLENARHDETGEHPLDTLGVTNWSVDEAPPPSSSADDGDTPQRVVFRYRLEGKGNYGGKYIVITKTYTLKPGDYHVGLEVKMYKETPDDKELWFRYQLAGAHGLPIEGKWYTNTFRNALIGQQEKANKAVYRDIQDARAVTLKEGGDEILRDPDRFIRYAAVAIQYFCSAIVVDDEQEKQDYLSRARPTVETTAVKGTVRSVAADRFVLDVGGKYDQTFWIDNKLRDEGLAPGMPLGVVYRTNGKDEDVVVKLYRGDQVSKLQPLFENDITVRVSTEPIDLKDSSPDKPVVHKYLLYNGPMKVMLLGHMTGPATVPDEVVTRYTDKLGLNTLVDYHSPGKMGEFANMIGWTWLVIHTTNLMHLVLGLLKWTGLPYPLCIIFLTIMVRGMMFPISRKAAMTNIKMQELQPEIKKLKEKFKDDPQALNREVWALQRRSGANPLSTCWLMFLQMPIFMGLYFALQESIFFRAAPAWPTWVPWMTNLAAPDMIFPWSESIPFISAPESYGSFFYLGPYFNILPVLAVTLMIFQQKYTMPPPTDEQQEMQQKMMKYMMVFMGLMFYKVPCGLVLYFIASSIWGFCERKLLPKKKKLATATTETSGGTSAPVAPTTAITVSNGSAKGRNRAKQGKKRKSESNAAPADNADGSMFQRVLDWWRDRRERVSDWWQKIQDEAQKKNR
jgi:YidC/Oxa1 family membrane protein insertase